MKTFTRMTEFYGQASGDCECFCFDRRTDSQAAADREAMHQAGYEGAEYEAASQREEAGRIYPDELLPEVEAGEYKPKGFGTWKITVEFTPDES